MLRRILAAAVTLALALTLLILVWPQLFGQQRSPLIAQAVSLRGLAVLGSLVCVATLGFLAVLARRARRLLSGFAVLLLAFSAINVVVLASRGFGNGGFEKPTDSSLTVLSWNTLGDAPGAEAIAELALKSNADVVTLPETTEETATAVAAIMTRAGRPMQHWTIAFDTISKSRSTSLLIASSLGGYTVNVSAPNSSVLPTVVATPQDGTGPTIAAVHLVAPLPGELPHWNSDLHWIAGACATDNVILSGDFNSTIDHYAGLATASGATLGNCIDAGTRSKNGAVGTWPTNLPAIVGTAIDHVMTTPNWRVSGMRVVQDHDTYGSDHRPILVQLTPAG
jgi:endonuclease/exonuclease/phosphatase (EEP) superfamily protein YafD